MDTSVPTHEPDWISRAIALVEIGGGVVGVVLVGMGLAGGNAGFGACVFSLLVLAAYVWSIVAGVKLWRQRPGGWGHSVVFQFLQIPWIVTPHVSYLFCAGPAVWIGWGSQGVIRSHTLLSRFGFEWASGFGPEFDARPWHIAINVIAVAIAAYLIWINRRPSAPAI